MAEPPFGHESPAIDVRGILGAGAIVAVAVLVVVVAVSFAVRQRTGARQTSAAAASVVLPVPRPQTHPADDLAALRAQKQAALSGWGWTDAGHTFARIPIERAMTIYLRQHPPATTAGAAAAPAQDSRP